MISEGALLGGLASGEGRLTRLVIQRGLAGIYLVAFVVAINQFLPLLGTHGLTPVPAFLDQVPFVQSPSLFYLHYSDVFVMLVSWSGVVGAALALGGWSERSGTALSVIVWSWMWVAYLSIVNVGQVWYAFGWETLLLEAGFLAMFFGARHTTPPVVVVWMYRWLIFRVMFGAGLIKLRGDPCWRDLTCLVYHFQTQPMPNPISWYLDQLPMFVDKLGVLFNHLAEVVAPIGLFVNVRWVRHAAGIIIVLFQVSILLSGNLSWLNWLTIVIALSCFDDALLARVLRVTPGRVVPTSKSHRLFLALLTLMVVGLSVRPALNLFSSRQEMNASFEPLHLVNTYGAFGSVSRKRFEVVLEGTTDSVISTTSVWQEYQFKAKPGDVARGLPWVAPYHLRLDWLMWFLPLGPGQGNDWLPTLLARLLTNDGPTLSLLANGGNPFGDRPPVWVRARVYLYRFTTSAERRTTGNVRDRVLLGDLVGPVSRATTGT